jgi:colanic acid/amylovoran biosynthesis protein
VRAVITHAYSDHEKGDLAIVVGTANALREVFPGIRLRVQYLVRRAPVSVFASHTQALRARGIEVEEGVLPSPHVEGEVSGLSGDLRAATRLVADAVRTSVALAESRMGPVATQAIETLRQADLVIAKGGHYLYNDQGGIRGTAYLTRLLGSIHVANRMASKSVLLGHSIGPVVGRSMRRLFARVLNRSYRVYARERYSLSWVRQLGVQQAEYCPDPAFLLEPTPSPVRLKGDYLGVTVAHQPLASELRAGRLEGYVTNLANALSEITLRTGLKVVLIPQVLTPMYGKSDMALSDRVAERVVNGGAVAEVMRTDLTPEELIDLYGQCQVVIGTRLHSCIFSSIGGTPAIGIEFHGHKTRGVMTELGTGEWVQRAGSLSDSSLVSGTEFMLRHRSHLSRQIRERVALARKRFLRTVGSLS